MTLTSFDLVSDFDGSINKTFTDVDFDSAVVNTIHNLGYVLLSDENENGLFDCRLIQTELGDIEHEFVSYSLDCANIEALTLLGYSIFESLTEAELELYKNKFSADNQDDDEEWNELDGIEDGKILAFEL